KETLAYIRKHSEGSPDLLPGLCLYAEQWLRAEVFPQFRDLKQEDASLKDYFADQTVQAYLEALPIEEDQVASAPSRQTASAPVAVGANLTTSRYREQEGAVTHQGSSYRPSSTMARSEGYTDQVHQGQSSGVGTMVGATATQDSRPSGYGNTALPTAERVSHLSPEGSLSHPNAQGNNDYALQPPQLTNVPHGTTISPRTRGQSGPRIDRLLLLAALGILGLLIMWMIASRIYSWISQTTQRPLLSGEQLEIQVNRPPVPITPLNPPLEASNVVEGELDESSAEKVIRTWLEAKKAAMGPSHDTSLLSDILVDGPLENWENRSATSKASNVYITYD
ncbi:MAG: DUF4101 domain-containing protein, partial [Merismopedia sp. SIO2A8]|nr:DUF4101 domain-containing protein [Merismopedia sp. SIO2A8]